ncbi:hypothetical protein [Butyrivibrio sp. YAB3001]|uniref:hypothetical protein n=1 Tax=Butyrivibrio sp. YAB3001 TaxID=1520812 RepID=UPI0008F61821|nr:hypothetical protein [Butyrivibrio sp. YAB3001]SFB86903.1 hypothetical protein SAMN02910398_00935 [Butyrivibrio sp. YAB3001]
MKEYSEIVIAAFATFTKTVDLMNATGLSKSTIVKYKKDEQLKGLAQERRQQIVKESVYKLQSELTKCVDVLAKIRDDTSINPQVRVYACNSIMSHWKEFTLTVDLIERIERLEQIENENE